MFAVKPARIPQRRHRHRHPHILARILVDTSDTRDFLKLLLWKAERHRSRDDDGEDVGVGVGVVECGLY